jgi:hypothetical protein
MLPPIFQGIPTVELTREISLKLAGGFGWRRKDMEHRHELNAAVLR